MPTKATYAYGQVRLPAFNTPEGSYELRISREGWNYDGSDAPSGVFTFDHARTNPQLTDIAVLRRDLATQDARLTTDAIDITIKDVWSFAGTDSITGHVAADMSAYQTTFFDNFFADTSQTYYVWLTRLQGITSEIVFAGTLDATTLEKTHSLLHQSNTSTELRIQTIKLHCAVAGLFAAKKVSDMKAILTTADMETAWMAKFFAGFTYQPGHIADMDEGASFFVANGHFASIGAAFDGFVINSYEQSWDNWVDVAGYGHVGYGRVDDNIDTTGGGLRRSWGIRITTILATIADLTHSLFTSTDFTPALSFGQNLWDATNHCYANPTSHIADPATLAVNYNVAFGVSPIDLHTMSTPATWADSATTLDVLRDLCFQFGCRLSTPIDQATGQLRIVLEPITAITTAFPLTASTIESQEMPRNILRGPLEISTKGFQGGIRLNPQAKGTPTQIQIPWRTKPFGNDTSPCFTHNHFQHNSKLDMGAQWLCFCRRSLSAAADSTGYDAQLNPDGWVGGAYLYQHDASTSNYHYPPGVDLANWTNDQPDLGIDWQGFYALRGATEDLTLADPWLNRENSIFAAAQIWGAFLTGERTVFKRTFAGITGGNGKVSDIQLGMTQSILVNGVATAHRLENLEIDLLKGTTAATFVAIPATVAEIPWEWIGDSNAGSGTASSNAGDQSGSGGGNSLSVTNNVTTGTGIDPLPVDTITFTHVNLAATLATIDSYTLVTGSRVWLAGQTTYIDRGLYIYSSTAPYWTRANTPLYPGAIVRVRRGVILKDTLWQIEDGASHASPLVINSDIPTLQRNARYMMPFESGAAGHLARFVDSTIFTGELAVESARTTELSARGQVEIPGFTTDTLPTLYIGSTTAGYVRTPLRVVSLTAPAIAASSDTSEGVVADSNTGTAILATSNQSGTSIDAHHAGTSGRAIVARSDGLSTDPALDTSSLNGPGFINQASELQCLVTVTGLPYTATVHDRIIAIQAGIPPGGIAVLNLPSLAMPGNIFGPPYSAAWVLSIRITQTPMTGTLNITPASGLIDGGATLALSAARKFVQLFYDGANWYSIS